MSFRGKAYADVVNRIGNASLYKDLQSEELCQLYKSFKEFNENNQERFQGLDKIFDSDGWQITDWVETITNQYIPQPCEILQLEKLFELCVKYNLMIYASY